MVDFLQTTEGIVTAASVYLLVGLGWNIVYNACGYLNLALGQFYILGAVLALELRDSFGIELVPLQGLLVVAAVGLLGFLCERLLLRPLGTFGLRPLIVTIGIALVLLQLARELAPAGALRPPDFIDAAPLDLGGVLIAPQEIVVWVTAAVLAGALFAFFRSTDAGRTMRACAENRAGAEALGIRVASYGTIAFTISAMLAAAAAFVVSPTQGVTYNSGDLIAIKAFMAVSIVGLGRNGGAVVGALAVAAAEGYIARYWSADVRDIAVLVGFLVVLYVHAIRDTDFRPRLLRRPAPAS